MQALDKDLRGALEKAIRAAREIAEDAARAAVDQLGIADPSPFPHLQNPERELRRRVRAHGRQLGDARDSNGVQQVERLVEEVAYEHWHQMLFARFLAENNLLMYDGVAVTIEECDELAADERAADGWELAARLATGMLPQIFRLDSPVFQLTFSPEYQQKLERIITGLPAEIFSASDSLGWVYQYWQSKRKEQVNASEGKVGARELSAVTQLFTEPYMVAFLLDNSLGAWWADRQLTDVDFKTATSEEELRFKASLPGVPLKYLRFVQIDDGSWRPAAGRFASWPDQLSKLKALDPCCGSGHFLVAAFLMLVPMRMKRDGLSAREAIDAVLRENLHGLELDQRCVELAAFALALTAWKYPNGGGYRRLPDLNIACSGLAISAKKDDWIALAGENTQLRHILEELYSQFKDAPVLGSLINPAASRSKGSLFALEWDEIEPLLTKALANEPDDDWDEMGVVAKGLSRAAHLLVDSYSLVMTNVPFLGRGKQTDIQKNFCDSYFDDAKSDLSTSMLRRCLDLSRDRGTVILVTPQVWLFQNSYSGLREALLDDQTWNIVAKLGSNAFQDMNWWAAVTLLSIISSGSPEAGHLIYGLDVGGTKDRDLKADLLQSSPLDKAEQTSIRNRPDCVVSFSKSGIETLLCTRAKSTEGLSTGDGDRFLRWFWEFQNRQMDWEFFQTTSRERTMFSGMSQVVHWEQGNGALAASDAARIQGHSAWNKHGVLLSRMNKLIPSLYCGAMYDKMAVVITPSEKEHLAPIWSYLNSPNYHDDVRQLSQNVAVATKTLAQVPFDFEHWESIAATDFPNGLPEPYSNDPTQWIFHGHPCGSVLWDEKLKLAIPGELRKDATVLQVAVARLLGYQWPAELDMNIELSGPQREWADRCEPLKQYVDKDGIVCIPAVGQESGAADRLLSLLANAYGSAWTNGVTAQLLASSDHAGKSLDSWLRDKFFSQHCALFGGSPFVWHVWDGLSDGFSALVNYHKLDYKTLEALIYTYLGDWISRQKRDADNGVDGAQEKQAAAETLKKRLELILAGEAPYDIFVRWKPIEEQPIGWNPDLNDGVRLNIRPFLSVPDVGKRGAGVLRDKPKSLHWEKDRGSDVPSAPWYELGLQYGGKVGDRINDYHLSLADKRRAREEKS